MANLKQYFKVHRAWEDWLAMGLGLAILLAPWVTKETANQQAVVSAAIAGIVVMMLGELDLLAFRRWVVLGQLLCGAWVAIAPLALGYAASGSLRAWHLAAGAIVVVLAAFELWQHRNRQPVAISQTSASEPGK